MCPMPPTVVSPHGSTQIHSMIDLQPCLLKCLFAILHLLAILPLDHMVYSLTRVILSHVAILEPERVLNYYISELAARTQNIATKALAQYARRLGSEALPVAELEIRKPQIMDSPLECTAPEVAALKATSPGVKVDHAAHFVRSCDRHSISFPRVETGPARLITSLSSRLSTIDPSRILDDKLAAELLALVPGTLGLCLWSCGEIQILAPNITTSEALELELPVSGPIPISISRWSPKLQTMKKPIPSNVSGDDWQALKMETGREIAECPSQTSDNDFHIATVAADCSLPASKMKTIQKEFCSRASEFYPSNSSSLESSNCDSMDPIKRNSRTERSTPLCEQNSSCQNKCQCPPPQDLLQLCISTEPVRFPARQSARRGVDSGKMQKQDVIVALEGEDVLESANAVSSAAAIASGPLSTYEPVQNGDVGPSLPQSSILINGSSILKSSMVRQDTRASSESNVTSELMAQTTPPAATTPPAGLDPPTHESGPSPARPPLQHMNNGSRVRIGPLFHCATAGVKVRRKGGNGDQFLTISTHAAFNGVNDNPLPVCVAKKRTIFSRKFKKRKSVQDIVGAQVFDAENNSFIGSIQSTLDAEGLTATANPVFPNSFAQNISLVGPLSRPPVRIRKDTNLLWSKRNKFDEVSVKVIGDGAQGQSFILGTFYTKPFPVHCSGKKVDLPNDVISRSVMFLRNDCPLQNDQILSGAPVVTAAEDGTFSEVVGFHAFQFGPPGGVAEDFNRSKQRLTKMIEESKITLCGAIMPSKEFKRTWDIVSGNE